MPTFRKKHITIRTQKKAAIMKAMREQGIAVRLIAEKMGMSEPSVRIYLKYELDEKWQEFSESITKMYVLQDFDMVQLLYAKLKKKMGKASFKDLSGLFKTVRTINDAKEKPASLTQTNIHFEITDGTKRPTTLMEVANTKEVTTVPEVKK